MSREVEGGGQTLGGRRRAIADGGLRTERSFYFVLVPPTRMHSFNNKIDKNWFDLSLNSFKLKCKNLFLEGSFWGIFRT